MGADEPYGHSVTGSLSVAIAAAASNAVMGATLSFTPVISGESDRIEWDFGDGTRRTNDLAPKHSWVGSGDFTVSLTAWNADHPEGVTALLTVGILASDVRFVNVANSTPAWPYANWATAANTIQDAVDAAFPGGVVWVSNGVYNTGGRIAEGQLSNRVVIAKAITVRSVSGPLVTTIAGRKPTGNGAIRGVYVGSGAVLRGFTITNGATRSAGLEYADRSGGGVYCNGGTVADCVVVGNTASLNGGGVAAIGGTVTNCLLKSNSAGYGGGTHQGTVVACTLEANTASSRGGGAYQGDLFNCLLWRNTSSSLGGGASESALESCTVVSNKNTMGVGGVNGNGPERIRNCIVYHNVGSTFTPDSRNISTYLTNVSWTCTRPMWAFGVGNITNEPGFAHWLNGDFNLVGGSPCRNAGTNLAWMVGATDRAGMPRLFGGRVDMGAYERSVMPSYEEWMEEYPSISGDDALPDADPDRDSMGNMQEYLAETDPTDPKSVFAFESALPRDGGGGFVISWHSVAGKQYDVLRVVNLMNNVTCMIASRLPATPPLNVFTDNVPAEAGMVFYRIQTEK
jgi:hypothetical protein